jgi:hypothetical protein
MGQTPGAAPSIWKKKTPFGVHAAAAPKWEKHSDITKVGTGPAALIKTPASSKLRG